jgi:anti-anti-sigma factor
MDASDGSHYEEYGEGRTTHRGFSLVPTQPPKCPCARGGKRAGATCKARPFSLTADQRDGLVYLRIGGDFDRGTVGRVQSALATLRGEPLQRIVFDLSGVTFLDLAALTTILRADQRGLREGYDVLLVRPPSLAGRVLILSRAREHLTIVNHPREAALPDRQRGPFSSEGRAAAPIEFRQLASEELSTCVRCRSNPAVWEAGQVVEGLVTLVSPDGPICGGCITKREQTELGEAILGDLRRGQPRAEAKIRALEAALTELRDSEPAG